MAAYYNMMLLRKPIFTKSITSAALTMSGDIFAQIYLPEGPEVKYDPDRTMRFTFLGAALCGAPLHYWYGWLARRFPDPGLTGAVQRLVVDQAIWAPTFIPLFMGSVLALEGKSLPEIKRKIEGEYLEALVANYAVWVPAQFINFYFVPVPFQVLMSNVTGLVWNTYFSFMAHRSMKGEKKESEEADEVEEGGDNGSSGGSCTGGDKKEE